MSAIAKLQVLCANCGEEVKSYGPETWHVESTMIRCDIPGNDGELDYIKATALKDGTLSARIVLDK